MPAPGEIIITLKDGKSFIMIAIFIEDTSIAQGGIAHKVEVGAEKTIIN